MRHPTDEDLILHQYGEATEARAIEDHLAECATCREAQRALQDTLSQADHLQVPWRGADYGQDVWRQLRPRLGSTRSRRAAGTKRVMGVVAVAASLAVAFLVGRQSRPPSAEAPQAISERARERILLVAVGRHLERSQMVLVELVNARGDGGIDIEAQREWAGELLPANRLYRQAASFRGESSVAHVLGDLERLLVEVAHGPSQISAQELREIQDRIASQGLLFKVRVIGSRARSREPALGGPLDTSTS